LSTWRERTIATAAVLATLFVAFAWGHAVRLLPVIDSARLRWGAGLGCIASGFLAGSVFCEIILPLLGAGPGVPRFDLALWAVFLIAVFFCAGVGLLLRGSEWTRGVTAAPPKTVS
ncbi:MAG TPA: hypothetical protein VHI52_14130, partial [Verrucomicrobiae bacterium]|nr:hypothetical protein [Verrucomicrobiae bacterium]